MRVITIFLIFSFALLIQGCRGCFNKVSDEIILPDQNAELISCLQGDWYLTTDSKFVLRIKRDTIIQLYNDSIRSIHSLQYSLNGMAAKYFKSDSTFNFLSCSGHSLSTDDFKLIDSGNNPDDNTTHTLAYVSRLRMEMNTLGKFSSFTRAK